MPLENGDYTIPHILSTGALGATLPVLTPSESGKLCIPVRLSTGALSLVEVETAQADDELAFPARLSNGELALVKEAAAVATETGTGTGTPSPADNSCNDCSPAIPDTLTLTMTGLGGDFVVFNGANTLSWTSGCSWRKSGGPGIAIFVIWVGGEWNVTAVRGFIGSCHLTLIASPSNTASCDPRDTYDVEESCSDGGCLDSDTCTKSAGASGVVTY